MLSRAQLDDLRIRNPIADVVAGYGVMLRRGAGPCAICGGDKLNGRFEETDGGRGWVCAVCHDGGDVIKLVMKVENLGFREAVERLGGVRAISPEEAARRQREFVVKRAQREAKAAAYREKVRDRSKAFWRGSLPVLDPPVQTYLNAREIFDVANMRVRYAPEQAYFDGEIIDETGRRQPRLVWRGPAMLAPLVGPDGRFAGVHITWIDAARPGEKAAIFDPETGEKLPAKKMRGQKAGGYIDVFPGGDPQRVYLGEGIETVASVREAMRDGAVYRVAGDLGNLAGPAVETVAHPTLKTPNGRPQRVPGPEPDRSGGACPVPAECRELILLKDGDSDPFLTDLAMRRAAARHRRAGRRIYVADPGRGVDFNDLARAP